MKTQKRKIYFLTEKEIQKIIKKIGKRKRLKNLRDKAIFETLFSTGLRVRELVALPDAPFASIKSRTMELSIQGKGGWQRPIYFSPACLSAIKKYIAMRDYFEIPETKLFPLTVRAVQLMVKRRALRAGIEGVHPHIMRHSFATDMLNRGVNLFNVKEFLGHKNIATTQAYLHATNSQLKNIHSKLYK